MNIRSNSMVILVLILFILCVKYILVPLGEKAHSEDKLLQRKLRISGVLVDVNSLSKGGSEFIMKNSGTKYRIALYSHNYNGGKLFWDVAQPGDSVYKAKGSDTLFLFKNNKVIPFVIW